MANSSVSFNSVKNNFQNRFIAPYASLQFIFPQVQSGTLSNFGYFGKNADFLIFSNLNTVIATGYRIPSNFGKEIPNELIEKSNQEVKDIQAQNLPYKKFMFELFVIQMNFIQSLLDLD